MAVGTARKRKSPGGGNHQGKKEKGKGHFLPSSYPVARFSVNGECATCLYFKQSTKRSFCAFSGENVPSGWRCDFWTCREVMHG